MKYIADLRAAFVGLTFLPQPLVVGGNNLAPKLVLHNEEIEYRALFVTGRLKYCDIKEVAAYNTWLTNNVIIVPDKGIFTISFNVRTQAQQIEILKLLQGKSCSLTKKALALISSTAI